MSPPVTAGLPTWVNRSLVKSVPVVVAQRHIVSGLTFGAVKQ
jgi:ABC-type maltose transport system permease subunit